MKDEWQMAVTLSSLIREASMALMWIANKNTRDYRCKDNREIMIKAHLGGLDKIIETYKEERKC